MRSRFQHQYSILHMKAKPRKWTKKKRKSKYMYPKKNKNQNPQTKIVLHLDGSSKNGLPNDDLSLVQCGDPPSSICSILLHLHRPNRFTATLQPHRVREEPVVGFSHAPWLPRPRESDDGLLVTPFRAPNQCTNPPMHQFARGLYRTTFAPPPFFRSPLTSTLGQ